MTDDKPSSFPRRRVLEAAGVAVAGLGLKSLGLGPTAQAAEAPAATGASVVGMRFEPRPVVRVGLVGCGGRGQSLLSDLLGIEKVEIKAICDVVPERIAEAERLIAKRGQPPPATFAKGDHDFENLCRRDDLDVVYIATPWSWHVPMALVAMNAGKHAFVEVPAATTLDDCWKLVDTSERTRRHCVMLENCCYGYNELLVLNMTRTGLLGELTHAEAAYIHDLRKLLFEDEGEGLWRRAEHFARNGNIYPTHGLGPVASYFDINRGDRFERLVSMSSRERSLSAYREANVPKGSPKRGETYRCGDMSTSLIQTAMGRTVMLQHDVVTPRPYDRINHVSGTKGAFRDYPPRLFQDGQAEHAWGTLEPWKAKFEHRLWTRLGKLAQESGHGGMDYVMSWRLMQCVREGLVPDMDVYDAAAWSAPAPLSEQSVAGGSAPVPFPDFTRGRWPEPRRPFDVA
jgi:Oxidoreductase family, NAD-binding Rossmann fold